MWCRVIPYSRYYRNISLHYKKIYAKEYINISGLFLKFSKYPVCLILGAQQFIPLNTP